MAQSDLRLALEAILAVSLAAVEGVLGANEVKLAYVSPGQPAWDCCPLVAVHAQTIGKDSILSTQTQGRFSWRNIVRVNADAVLCVTTNTDEVSVGGSGAQHAEMGWRLWCALTHALDNGTLLPPKCRSVGVAPAVVLQPAGGCAGWRVAIDFELSGYDA